MKCLVAVLVLVGTVFAGTGHIYNLTDGGVTVLKYSRWHGEHGPTTATMPSGELLKGEYSVSRNGSASWGSIYSSLYGTVGSENVNETVNSTSSRFRINRQGQGSLILTGDKGTIMTCEFIASGHGYGACLDNHGVRYKFLF